MRAKVSQGHDLRPGKLAGAGFSGARQRAAQRVDAPPPPVPAQAAQLREDLRAAQALPAQTAQQPDSQRNVQQEERSRPASPWLGEARALPAAASEMPRPSQSPPSAAGQELLHASRRGLSQTVPLATAGRPGSATTETHRSSTARCHQLEALLAECKASARRAKERGPTDRPLRVAQPVYPAAALSHTIPRPVPPTRVCTPQAKHAEAVAELERRQASYMRREDQLRAQLAEAANQPHAVDTAHMVRGQRPTDVNSRVGNAGIASTSGASGMGLAGLQQEVISGVEALLERQRLALCADEAVQLRHAKARLAELEAQLRTEREERAQERDEGGAGLVSRVAGMAGGQSPPC